MRYQKLGDEKKYLDGMDKDEIEPAGLSSVQRNEFMKL